MARPPDFVILGAMRAGTTTLARQLERLPGVGMAPEKEVHYFDRHYDRGPAWYASRLGDGAVVGEATPNYLYHPEALVRLAADAPDVRVVVTLRDPADRAWSHYWHNVARGKEPLMFADALIAEPERLARSDPDRDHYSYVDRGRYRRQLDVVTDLFPADHIHVMTFEHHRVEPQRSLASVARFLRLDPTPAELGHAADARSGGSVRFRSIALRNRSRTWPEPLKRVVGRLNSTSAPTPPMPAPERAMVTALVGDQRVGVSSPE